MKKTKYLVYWNPYEEEIQHSIAEAFTDLFQCQQNIVTIDLKNNKDPRSLRLLREADLVVVFIKQSIKCFDLFFSRDYIPGEKVIYVITDYIFDGTPEWPAILGQYRIPRKRLFFLPFHNQMKYMTGQGYNELREFVYSSLA